jgi:hypothetical protein
LPKTNEWIIALDPTRGTAVSSEVTLAPRPKSLDGAVVGLISNGKGQASPLLDCLYGELGQFADLAGRVVVSKSAFYAEPTAEDSKRLTSEASVTIAAFGG